MLLERERHLGAVLDVPRQQGEPRQAETAKRAVKVWSAHGHEVPLRARGVLSCLGKPVADPGGQLLQLDLVEHESQVAV